MNDITSELSGNIIDAHCHIASTEYFPASFINGIIDNMKETLVSRGADISNNKISELYLSKFQDPDCDQLILQMDEAGIQHSILLLADFTYALKDCPLTIEEMLNKHIAVINRHAGRLSVFAGIDPRWGETGLSLFKKAVDNKQVKGFKVYPPCGFTPSDRLLYPFYEICEEYRLPVLVHIGATSPVLDFEPAQPIYIDQATRDFPNVHFILAHGSVHYPDECAMLCANRPNVYLDVSGYEVSELYQLKHLFSRGINHKVLFGTDWPLFRLRGSQKDFVDMLLGNEDIFSPMKSTQEISGFFYRNCRRILNI